VNFIISEFLETFHYNVISCNCGYDALKVIEERAIDLVLLDIVMPDIDGFSVAKKMKAFFGKDNFVPIILVTGLTDMDEKIAGLEYADDIISKPCSHKELLARIKVMLRIRSLQRELVASRKQYHFLYENVPSMYVSIDDKRIITNCNEQFRMKNGVLKQEIIGGNIEDFFLKEDRNALDNFIESIRLRLSVKNDPVLVLTPLNSSLPHIFVSLGGVYMGDEHGLGYSVEIVMQDVTNNIKIQQEQRDARKQLYLSARLASIGTLAAGVAHELNNPLTAILGFSNALLNRTGDNADIDKAELNQYLSIINFQTLRCRDIIENLSKFACEAETKIEKFRVGDSVDNVIKFLGSKVNKKNIKIAVNIPENIIAVADSRKFEQTLIYILTNSIEFCNEGSIVTIAAESASNMVKLLVEDNGPGISPDIVSKVFDPFFTTKNVGEGAGLGLAICHHMMEECNGNIDIESEKGCGTKVTLELPAG
jgi:two-component system, NtrC family, sensor kinase